MTLIQLGNFIRVVELQSLSKAAGVVRIAQPALSRQIRALEAELGVALLVRHGWGVTATPAGAALVDHGRRVLKSVETTRNAVSAMAVEPTGRVSLTVPSSLAMTLLPPLSAVLSDRYPAVRPHFMDSFSSATPARILAGDLDLAIMNQNLAQDALMGSPLLSEDLILVGRAGYDLKGAKTTLEILCMTPLVVPSRPNSLRLIVDQATRGASENIALEADSLPAMLGIARVGRAFAVLPYSTVSDDIEDGRLSAYELNQPRLSRTLSLLRPAGRPLTPAISAVDLEIRNIVRDLAARRRWKPL
jgi:LysR family nitrogen assimilation transcriptional regulator